jgi:hypothetical protein
VGLQGPVGRRQRTGAGAGSPPCTIPRAFVSLTALGALALVAAVAATPSSGVLLEPVSTLEGPAPPTAATTRRGTDGEAHIRFTLDGRLLIVRLLRGATRATRREVYGKRIHAACGTDFNFSRGVKVGRTRMWPRGQRRVRYRFRRNISRRAKWCLIEHPAGADVGFASLGR